MWCWSGDRVVEQRGLGLRAGDLDLNLGAGVYKQWDLGQQYFTSASSYPTLVEFYIVPVIDIHILFLLHNQVFTAFLHRSTQKTKSLEIAFM